MAITYRTACSAQKSAGTTTSTTITYASAVSSGDLLLCAVRVGDDTGTDTISVSDSVNGSWGSALGTHSVTGMGTLAIYAFDNSGAGTPVVTITQSSSASLRVAIAA